MYQVLNLYIHVQKCRWVCLFVCLFLPLRAAHGSSQTRGLIGVADLHPQPQQHQGSKLHLRPTLQLAALLEP